MAQLNRRIDKDKIDAIGASNWSHERISSANIFAVSNGLQSFPASSV
jgi:aryl-alcohol dehydrogenase-like predicted oxidoreductase